MPETPELRKLLPALLAVYLVWGSTYFAIKLALPGYPPFLLTGIRLAIAGGLMLAWLWHRKAAWPRRDQWPAIVLLSLLMMVVSNALINVAEQHVSSGVVAIGVAIMPIWAGVFAMWRGYHPSQLEWFGLLLGFVGVIWLNLGSELRVSVVGLLCVLVAPLSWAFGSIWSKGRDLPEPLTLAAWQMLIGSVLSLALGVALGERLSAPGLGPTLAMLYLALFGSIIAYTAFLWLLQNVRPALATSYAYVNPPIALLLGVWLLDEPLSPHTVLAMLLILAGVGLLTLGKRLQR